MAKLARLCVLATFIAHVAALALSDGDAASSPISQLSRGDRIWIHSTGLLALALGWLLVGTTLWSKNRGFFWIAGCVLLAANAVFLPYIAYYFASAPESVLFGPDANDPLAILASVLGVAMGAFQIEFRRSNPTIARANLTILILWVALVPLIPFLTPDWIGAYERTVGALMLAWTVLLTLPGARGYAEEPSGRGSSA